MLLIIIGAFLFNQAQKKMPLKKRHLIIHYFY
jgi:hypothetical protein